MNDYLTLALAVLSSSAVGAIITTLMNRRKIDIDNEDKISQMAMSLASDFEEKYKAIKEEYETIKEENKLLKVRVETLEVQLLKRTQTTSENVKNSNLRGFG